MEKGLVVALGEVFDFDRVAVEFLFLVEIEADERVLARGGLHVLHLELLDLLLAGRCLARLGFVGREARDEVLQVGDAVLRLGVRREQLLARLRRGEHIVVVAARINTQRAVVQVRHVRADGVEEVPVVRNDDDGALALVEDVLQPADRVDVQVVGRLVQQQDVGIGE